MKTMYMYNLPANVNSVWRYTYYWFWSEKEYQSASRSDLVWDWIFNIHLVRGFKEAIIQKNLGHVLVFLFLLIGSTLSLFIRNIPKLFFEFLPLLVFTYARDLAKKAFDYAGDKNHFLPFRIGAGFLGFFPALVAGIMGVIHFLTRSLFSPAAGAVEAYNAGVEKCGSENIGKLFLFGRIIISIGLTVATFILAPVIAVNAAIESIALAQSIITAIVAPVMVTSTLALLADLLSGMKRSIAYPKEPLENGKVPDLQQGTYERASDLLKDQGQGKKEGVPQAAKTPDETVVYQDPLYRRASARRQPSGDQALVFSAVPAAP